VAAFPEQVSTLIAVLAKLPGIGPRSAERIALHIIQAPLEDVRNLANVLVNAREKVHTCSTCGGLTEYSPCGICVDSRREASLVCVVERPVDIINIEKSGTFRGKYHVLGGKISPLNGVQPEDLAIGKLEERLQAEPIRELLIALGSDLEGDATTYYLAKRLAREGVRITRLAHGLPAGTGLEFADEITLTRAIEDRREIS
jgi:recombination protein RecR